MVAAKGGNLGNREAALWLHVRGRFGRPRAPLAQGWLRELGRAAGGYDAIFLQLPNNDGDKGDKYISK